MLMLAIFTLEEFEDISETDLSSADTSRRTSEVGQSFSERRQSAHELKKLFVKKLSERDLGQPDKNDELEDVAEETISSKVEQEIVATETKQDGNKQDTKSISEYVADEAEKVKDQNDSNETQTHTCADDPYCSSSKTEENKEIEVENSDDKNLESSEIEEEKDHDEALPEKTSSDVEETESSPAGKDNVSSDLKDEGCLPSTEEKVPQNGSEPHIEKEVQDDKNIDLKEQINEDNRLNGKEETSDANAERTLIKQKTAPLRDTISQSTDVGVVLPKKRGVTSSR